MESLLIGRPKYMLAVDMPDCVSLAYATEQDILRVQNPLWAARRYQDQTLVNREAVSVHCGVQISSHTIPERLRGLQSTPQLDI